MLMYRSLVVVHFFGHASKLMPADSTVKVDLRGPLFPNLLRRENAL
jgi:hypothetical protein